MKRRSLVTLVLAVMAAVCLDPLTSNSEEPADSSEMKRISETIQKKYSHHVYIVNAWSKITCDANGNKMNDKTIRWRRRIGTAFPLRECGYLVTPLCVVNHAERISVIPFSGDEVEAQIVGTDAQWKIAVLKIIEPETLVPPPPAPHNSIGKGSQVVLLGIPQENSLIAQPGTVRRILPDNGSFIVSVAGNPGTTGTLVFTTGAQFLGILTYHLHKDDEPGASIDQGKEVYLVIPIEYTLVVAQSIINNNERNRGWLGIRINLVNFNSDANGVVIQQIVENSPASQAGLKILDRITEFNGSPITTLHEMCDVISRTGIGETATITVLRNNNRMNFSIILAAHPTIP